MRSMHRNVCAAFLCSTVLGVTTATAQTTRCATEPAVVDSARNDVLEFLRSDAPLIVELRAEQSLQRDAITAVPVTERAVCSRMWSAFKRAIAANLQYAVVKVGPLYYARDPDQRRSTGVLVDSTFRVVMRFGAEVPNTVGRP